MNIVSRQSFGRVVLAGSVMVLFALMIALVLHPGPRVQAWDVHQAIIKVPDDYATIQTAVDAAADGDEIWVATGVYTGVQTHDGETQVVYISKTVTIRGGYSADFAHWNPDIYPTTLDAEKQGRVFYITGFISPVVEGLRITGGMAGYAVGGGVCVITATATISNSRIFSNTAGLGGGISLQASAARLQNNAIATNFADWGGGGLYLQSSPAVLDGNTVSTNTAYSFSFPVYGGGLYLVESTATLTSNTVVANTVEGNVYEGRGGGLYLRSSPASLNGNVISHNGAWGLYATGGGAHLYQSDAAVLVDNTFADNGAFFGGGLCLEESDSTFNGNIVVDNRAYTGGGLALDGSAAALDGNVISGNAARGDYGGGVSLSSSAAVLSGNTITTNTAELGGGGLYLTKSGATLDRNIISSNIVSSTVEEEEGGGGLYLMESNATLNGNTIIANIAEHNGGGLYLRESSDALLVNNIIADNQASVVGSGLCIEWAYPRLLHTTIARNSGGDGSGIYIKGHYTVALTNTILVSHTVGVQVAAGTTVTLEATLWGTDTWANGTDWSGGGAIVTGAVSVWGDPAFVVPDAGDYHIGPDSAARDKGVNAGIAVDIDGDARQDPYVDIGADEYVGIPVTLAPSRSAILQPGQTVVYTHTLTNGANVTDTYALTATSSQAWLTSYAPSTITLASGNSVVVWVTVTVPGDVISGMVDTTMVTATSATTPTFWAHVTDTTTAGHLPDVALAPDRAKTSPPGIVVYTHTLTNTSNGTDTFDVTYASSQGWAQVSPTEVTLDTGNTATVWVTVTAPGGVVSGTVDATVVTATSQADSNTWATVTDTTTASGYHLFLPLILKNY